MYIRTFTTGDPKKLRGSWHQNRDEKQAEAEQLM